MKKIAISTLILGISLYGGMFEHPTDVKENYWFDNATHLENMRLAAELAKFQNATATQDEIDSYIKARDDDNETKLFADDVYADAQIIKDRKSKMPEPKVYAQAESCGWFFGLFGCDKDEKVTDINATSAQTAEEIQSANEAAEAAIEKLDSELLDTNSSEEVVEEKGAFQDSVDATEPEEQVEVEVAEQTQSEENPKEGAEQ